MRRALLLLVVLSAFVAGCESKYKDPDPVAMGYDYYPLEIGQYRVYNVTDIRVSNNISHTSQFQLRERVDTSFHDQTGQLVYKIVRSVRPNENSGWLDDSVIIVNKSERMVLAMKDNTKYIKMVFPVDRQKIWEMDAYNNRVIVDSVARLYQIKERYTYENVDQSFNIEDIEFSNTVTVKPIVHFVEGRIDERREVYARNIGLVYRLFNKSTPCEFTSRNDCPKNVGWIASGHEREEILIEHGKL
ncbi:hypothetical protein [Pontibacter sp. HSC-36F09]|uniref:hypothetical protein n=1 Tax=Pontibacter sp. HSC-36F09 TaxID=2910966 RepID=UPI00209EFC61|nr:hypothetical protein [Pontibacter sp. HSC-36F09]MCP2045025.1 hypothetical protein [Pontibacter sp. HSC-36F09]